MHTTHFLVQRVRQGLQNQCRKLFLIVVILLFQASGLQAQDAEYNDPLETENIDTVAWIHDGIFSLGVNQGFLHNWAAGGEIASLIANGIFHLNITHFNRNKVWSNDLEIDHGLNYSYSNFFVPRKTNDNIDLTSMYAIQIKRSKNFYLAGLFNFKSQFSKGYDYLMPEWQKTPTSTFLSPAYVTLAVGVEYKKGKLFTFILSPLAAREILASAKYTSLSPDGAFGIDSGKTSDFQLGALVSARFKKDVNKNITVAARLDLYNNYLADNTVSPSGVVVTRDHPGNIQVYLNTLLMLKAYKGINITFGLTAIYNNDLPYDKTYTDPVTKQDIDKNLPGEELGWLQVNQIFTFGFMHKF